MSAVSAVSTLEVMAPLAQAAALVQALLPLLAPADRVRVQAAAAGGARGLMARLEPAPGEPQDPVHGMVADGAADSRERCLTLSFEADDALLAFAADEESAMGQSDAPAPADGRVQVGCWWCTLKTGTLYLQFGATPATAVMGELLQSSAQVQAAFLQLAQAVPGAALVRVDAWHEAVLLWADAPAVAAAQAGLARPEPQPLPPLDAYCRHLLAHGRADSGRVYA